MEQPKEYYAFISYKREDKKEGSKLSKGTNKPSKSKQIQYFFDSSPIVLR